MKTENITPELPAEKELPVPAKKDDRPGKVVDNAANAAKFKEKWEGRKGSDGKTRVHLPGTRRSVEMNHVEVTGNVISVWTSSEKTAAPDFVIVNAPTEVPNEHGILVEDHLTAIALAIDGVTK